ncbi:DUF302 domain-containing protein [Rhizobiales bacterium]|uniref:DUF302 domain-containing protein n=1 Tax=Hongsoonwoonella zoysiae TaxID=2821844 RepID=UPI0015615272|nr:DUF302 domain-containing protein [Hongsoonwoonella zoysiae]NRG19301.1 DUF302 domain-containing protein [Hongsoonwoonella zoysiae]
MNRFAMACLFALAFLAPAGAQATQENQTTKAVKATFEDVMLELQDAVIGRGLVIDYTGHVDKMLERTAEAAGGVTTAGGLSPYLNAKYVQFCSAKLTHEAVNANPQNLSICPYLVFIYETKAEPGTVHVGYRKPVFDPSQASEAISEKINAFLQEIVDDVASAEY